MSPRYFYYALFVTVIATWTSWGKMFDDKEEGGTGSSWSSGRSSGGGWSGGGHK